MQPQGSHVSNADAFWEQAALTPTWFLGRLLKVGESNGPFLVSEELWGGVLTWGSHKMEVFPPVFPPERNKGALKVPDQWCPYFLLLEGVPIKTDHNKGGHFCPWPIAFYVSTSKQITGSTEI